jgi:hypothetical protein
MMSSTAAIIFAVLTWLPGAALAETPEIVYIPPGASYRIGELERPILAAHWLMPDSHYRRAITLAKTLEVVEPALESCIESHTKLRSDVVPALEGARHQLELSAARLAAEREKTMRAKQSALRAWSVTAGVLVGAGVAYAATR